MNHTELLVRAGLAVVLAAMLAVAFQSLYFFWLVKKSRSGGNYLIHECEPKLKRAATWVWLIGSFIILVAFASPELIIWMRARMGNRRAVNSLAAMYEKGGNLFRANDSKAFYWNLRAAEQGDHCAQLSVARDYRDGLGVAKDEALAVRWYRQSTESGNSCAMNELGNLLIKGAGVPKDEGEAIRLIERAAGKGCVSAMRNLGTRYWYGKDVPRDPTRAMPWLIKAAEQKDENCKYLLAQAYATGEGVARNEELAQWFFKEVRPTFEKWAKDGSGHAQWVLGRMYLYGQGMDKDADKAKAWFSKAASSGYGEAKKDLAALTSTHA